MGANWETPTSPPAGDPQTYHVKFPRAVGPQECLAEGFQGRVAMWKGLRVHSLQFHVRDNVIIMEEVNLPHPR